MPQVVAVERSTGIRDPPDGNPDLPRAAAHGWGHWRGRHGPRAAARARLLNPVNSVESRLLIIAIPCDLAQIQSLAVGRCPRFKCAVICIIVSAAINHALGQRSAWPVAGGARGQPLGQDSQVVPGVRLSEQEEEAEFVGLLRQTETNRICVLGETPCAAPQHIEPTRRAILAILAILARRPLLPLQPL